MNKWDCHSFSAIRLPIREGWRYIASNRYNRAGEMNNTRLTHTIRSVKIGFRRRRKRASPIG